jgi:hypothetical protein
MTDCSGLLISWASEAASLPATASFSDWTSAACACFRAVMSSIMRIAKRGQPPAPRTSDSARRPQITSPSWRTKRVSRL